MYSIRIMLPYPLTNFISDYYLNTLTAVELRLVEDSVAGLPPIRHLCQLRDPKTYDGRGGGGVVWNSKAIWPRLTAGIFPSLQRTRKHKQKTLVLLPSENSWSAGPAASSKVMLGLFLNSLSWAGWLPSSPPINLCTQRGQGHVEPFF